MMSSSESGLVDLRSDTVTRPSPAMRQAMATADVGDDVYREDPTVNVLEERFADLVGKEAAMYVPSGTMGNQIALRVQGRPGTSVVAGARQHIVVYERGAAGLNGQYQFYVLDDQAGIVDVERVRWLVASGEDHYPPVSLVCIENSHLPSGGLAISLDDIEALSAVGVPLHLDGARLFNASVASGVKARDYGAAVTTMMCCLSKGLGAPVGSMLAGAADLMGEARDHRKRLGGGMRQAGVLAAAGLLALDNIERLADDHERACRLADVVADRWPGSLRGFSPDDRPSTNIVAFAHPDAEGVVTILADHGVLCGLLEPGVVRLVTHLDVDDAGIERAISALSAVPGA